MNASPLQRAIELIGSQSALSRRCGASQQKISYWLRKAKRVPAEFVLPIERATGGQITRYELRPDLYLPADAEQSPPPYPDASPNRRQVPDRRATDRRQEPTRRAVEATPGRRTGGERRQGERRGAKAAENPPKPKEADRAA